MGRGLRVWPADWPARLLFAVIGYYRWRPETRSACDLRMAITRSSALHRRLFRASLVSAVVAPVTAVLDPSGYERLWHLCALLGRWAVGAASESLTASVARVYADGSLPVDALSVGALLGAILGPAVNLRRTPEDFDAGEEEVRYREETRIYDHPLARSGVSPGEIGPSASGAFAPWRMFADTVLCEDHAERSPQFDRLLLNELEPLWFRERRDRKAHYLHRRRDESGSEHAERLGLLVRTCGDNPRTVDEDKFGLAFPADGAGGAFDVYRAGYFDGLVTNDACRYRLRERDREAQRSGGDTVHANFGRLFPLERSDVPAGLRLRPLGTGGMSNHVGITTLAITPDLRPVLFQQGMGSLAHPGKVVASGSGSADYADLRRPGRAGGLRDVIRYAMARELHEEASLPEDEWASRPDAPLVANTRVLGFFRWVERGGKPEFVGVTRIRSTDVRPAAGRKRKEVVAIRSEMPRIDSVRTLARLDDLVRDALDAADGLERWSIARSSMAAIARLGSVLNRLHCGAAVDSRLSEVTDGAIRSERGGVAVG